MSKREQTSEDPNERLDPKVYADLARIGWRTPQTEAEVRAAEEWAAKSPSELPARLHDTPDIAQSDPGMPGSGSILSRYLRDDRSSTVPSDTKSREADSPDRELDLER